MTTWLMAGVCSWDARGRKARDRAGGRPGVARPGVTPEHRQGVGGAGRPTGDPVARVAGAPKGLVERADRRRFRRHAGFEQRIATGRRIWRRDHGDILPIGAKLVGHELCEAGPDALPGLGLRDCDGDLHSGG